jgi:hypothetical protein
MKLGIMQPYFLPYIGYFQLINAVDAFVVYDNIEYTKKGWINRNRILVNGKDKYITLPLKKDSDYLNIDQRYLSDLFLLEKRKLLGKVRENYRKAPYFADVYKLLENILDFDNINLFHFVYNSLVMVCNYLDISKEFIISSSLSIDHNLKSEDKVLEICKQVMADCYINPIGGINLYSRERFIKNSVVLYFLSTNPIRYSQLSEKFTPNLSILDVMMFNSKERITYFLNNEYTLI